MTCSTRSASAVSSSVARNAATSVCGRRSMNPTVSLNSSSRRSGRSTRRTSGSSVTNNAFDASAFERRQSIEQRGLAGVGIADQRHRRHVDLVAALAQLRPPAAHDVDVVLQRLHAHADAPAIRFELRFARAPACRCRRQGATAPRSTRPGAAAGTSTARARPAACLRACARASRRCRESAACDRRPCDRAACSARAAAPATVRCRR